MNKIDKIYKIKGCDTGFSIWLNGRWILDASTFLSDGEVSFDRKRFKVIDDSQSDDIILLISTAKHNKTNTPDANGLCGCDCHKTYKFKRTCCDRVDH